MIEDGEGLIRKAAGRRERTDDRSMNNEDLYIKKTFDKIQFQGLFTVKRRIISTLSYCRSVTKLL